MDITTIELRKLTAAEGMVLTNGETFSTEVYLGANDSPDNWREIPEADLPEGAEYDNITEGGET